MAAASCPSIQIIPSWGHLIYFAAHSSANGAYRCIGIVCRPHVCTAIVETASSQCPSSSCRGAVVQIELSKPAPPTHTDSAPARECLRPVLARARVLCVKVCAAPRTCPVKYCMQHARQDARSMTCAGMDKLFESPRPLNMGVYKQLTDLVLVVELWVCLQKGYGWIAKQDMGLGILPQNQKPSKLNVSANLKAASARGLPILGPCTAAKGPADTYAIHLQNPTAWTFSTLPQANMEGLVSFTAAFWQLLHFSLRICVLLQLRLFFHLASFSP